MGTTLGLVCSLLPAFACAHGFFLSATDARLRDDLTLLIDEGVINLPANVWPVPAADVASAMRTIDVESIHELALRFAALRVAARVELREDDEDWRVREVRAIAGKEGLLRDYATIGRDHGALNSTGGAATDRWSVTLSGTAAISPSDEQELRLDGSEISVRMGNWILSANQFERWWGPGLAGSLIVSTNARPMPGISVDRLRSHRFDVPVLRLLGPWRFVAFIDVMESNRPDVDQPLFMGMRVSFKPAPILELGLSRTAQFCGKGRGCNPKSFWNVLAGNDNAGLRVDADDEPGNQMAGMDLRIVSPFRALPVALYTQLIGEDSSASGIPERYLGQFGIESWTLLNSGGRIKTRLEYANTNCKFNSPTKDLAGFSNCAYRQAIFSAGYRYRGRNIGHTADADSESTSAEIVWLRSGGDHWGLRVQHVILDRHGGIDPSNRLTQGPGTYRAGELAWSGRLLSQDVSAQLGYERIVPGAARPREGAFGFLQWRKTL